MVAYCVDFTKKNIDFIKNNLLNEINILVNKQNFFYNKKFMQTENIVSLLKEKTQTEQLLLTFLLSTAYEIEKKFACSFLDVFKNLNNKPFESLHDKIFRPYKDDIEFLMQKCDFDQKLKNMLFDVISLAGFNGKIVVEKSINQNISTIEKQQGYIFNLNVNEKYCGIYDNPKIALIDGYIENVSEIHLLLETTSISNECLVLFHRGMSDDVLNTLTLNWNRGTLKIIPVLVEYDIEGINTLNDLAVIVGCDVLSSLKGQLISTSQFSDFIYVEKIEILHNKIVILNKKNIQNIKYHINELIKKRQKVNDELSYLYDKRIKSLSTNLVNIKLINDINYINNRQKIDKFLRAYKDLVQYGVIKNENDKMLTTTYLARNEYTEKIIEKIKNLGCILCLKE